MAPRFVSSALVALAFLPTAVSAEPAPSGVLANSAGSLALPEVLVRARSASPEVRLAELALAEAEASRVGQGIVLPVNPRLAVDGRRLVVPQPGSPVDPRGGATATVEALFEVSGAGSARLEEASRRVDVARAELALARDRAQARAWGAWVELQVASLRVAAADEAVALQVRVEAASRERQAAGVAAGPDVAALTVERAGAQALLAEARVALASARASLAQVLDVPVARLEGGRGRLPGRQDGTGAPPSSPQPDAAQTGSTGVHAIGSAAPVTRPDGAGAPPSSPQPDAAQTGSTGVQAIGSAAPVTRPDGAGASPSSPDLAVAEPRGTGVGASRPAPPAPGPDDAAFPPPPEPSDAAALLDRALSRRPELAGARARLGLLDAADVRLAREAAPKVGALAGYDASPASASFGFIGLSVELPVAQRNQGPRAVVGAQRATEAERLALAQRQVAREVALARERVLVQQQRLALVTGTSLPAAREAQRLVEEGWRAGRFDVFRLALASRELVRARQEQLEALRLAWLDFIELERVSGGLSP